MAASAEQILKEYFGYGSFRPHQGRLIEAVLAGQDVLGVMPTGAGKSLVFQVPALACKGTTIVVSPLISLMKDQVDALRQSGVEAELLNSSLLPDQKKQVMGRVSEGRSKLLYVAPERLEDAGFLALCQSIDVPLVAVDEAHCVSQWGNDFRPSYSTIPAFIAKLAKRPVVCALTATATGDVREDIVRSLALREPLVSVAGFDRENLYLGVLRPEPAKKRQALLAQVKKHKGESGIIYCSTRAATEEVQAMLQEQGLAATIYHAGLQDVERKRNQDDFLYDRKPVMVATNAFGMGIDKSNISFVIHYNMPSDLESYYQEAGRAGRDGSPADCVLIYNSKDVQTVNYFAEKGHEERLAAGMDSGLSAALYSRDLGRIRKMTSYCKTSDCLRSFILRYFGESDTPYRCERCSSCEAESEVLDVTVEAQKIISCVLRLEQRDRAFGRVMVVDVLRGSAAQNILRLGLDSLSTYGIMKDVPKAFVHAVLDALLEAGLLAVSDGKYPVIGCTAAGRGFLKQAEPFCVKMATAKTQTEVEEPAAAGRSRSAGVTGGVALEGIDQDLFARLKALRLEIARAQELPAFVIFHDSTLAEMCVKRPKTTEEFLTVSGVGQKKTELYAKDFLDCINAGC